MPLVQKKDFSLNIGGNIAYNRNVVTDLGGLDSITAQSYWASTEIGDDYIIQVGQPMGNMYGFVSDGFYTTDDFNWDGSSGYGNFTIGQAGANAVATYALLKEDSYKDLVKKVLQL